jgi:hypothetical protein
MLGPLKDIGYASLADFQTALHRVLDAELYEEHHSRIEQAAAQPRIDT